MFMEECEELTLEMTYAVRHYDVANVWLIVVVITWVIIIESVTYGLPGEMIPIEPVRYWKSYHILLRVSID